MLIANLLTTSAMVAVIYLLLKQMKIKSAFWLSLISLFIPARMLILRSVGAPETLFITAILGSIYFYRQKKYWPAGIFLAIAQLTKSPAVLLFGAYIIDTFLNVKWSMKKWLNKIPLLLGPAVLIPLFLFFQNQKVYQNQQH